MKMTSVAMRLKVNARRAASLLLLIIASTFFPPVSGAGVQADDNRGLSRKEIVSALELIYRGAYDESIRLLDEKSRLHPGSPGGDFYRAVALMWKSYVDARLETGSRAFDTEIESSIESAAEKAHMMRRSARSREDEIEALFYLGSAYAIRSRLALHQKHALPAARFAKTAQDFFDELLKLDPDYPDAYYAAGSIYYQVGKLVDSPIGRVATMVLGGKSLPKGDRERGLEYLKKAANAGVLTQIDAKLALLEIRTFDEPQLADALRLARELQTRYPGNQTFARYVLKIYLAQKDRAGVTRTARGILSAVKQGKPNFGPFLKREAERAIADSRRF